MLIALARLSLSCDARESLTAPLGRNSPQILTRDIGVDCSLAHFLAFNLHRSPTALDVDIDSYRRHLYPATPILLTKCDATFLTDCAERMSRRRLVLGRKAPIQRILLL